MEKENIFKWAKIALILLVVFLGAETLGSLKALRDLDPAYNSISVSGTGEMVVVPNVASFSFSVSDDQDTATEAQSQVTEKMNTILAELKAFGIEDRDIKTTDYSLYPKYVYETRPCSVNYCPPPSTPTENGYTASHSVSVKVRKTEDAGKALSLVGEKGATNLSNISFTVLD